MEGGEKREEPAKLPPPRKASLKLRPKAEKATKREKGGGGKERDWWLGLQKKLRGNSPYRRVVASGFHEGEKEKGGRAEPLIAKLARRPLERH